jgi:hypothetical protein
MRLQEDSSARPGHLRYFFGFVQTFLGSGIRLSRGPLVRRGREVLDTSSGFSHRTPDFGVFSSGGGLPALCPLVDALQSLALTLFSSTLALIRKQLSVVRRLLAIIRDSVPLIGDAISFISDPLAPQELTLTPRERLLALIDPSNAAIESTCRVGTVPGDHDSP